MPAFQQGDIVIVPFPYIDHATRQRRPALVLSKPDLESRHGIVWVAMITSAGNAAWPSDVAIRDHAAAGLPAPSVIRSAKIATIDAHDAVRIGSATKRTLAEVMRKTARQLGIRLD